MEEQLEDLDVPTYTCNVLHACVRVCYAITETENCQMKFHVTHASNSGCKRNIRFFYHACWIFKIVTSTVTINYTRPYMNSEYDMTCQLKVAGK